MTVYSYKPEDYIYLVHAKLHATVLPPTDHTWLPFIHTFLVECVRRKQLFSVVVLNTFSGLKGSLHSFLDIFSWFTLFSQRKQVEILN